MGFESSKVLYKHFLELGRLAEAKDLLKRFPDLEEPLNELLEKPLKKPKKEEKK